ncbi:MAG: 50S ribosomal protein L11 methyltransferase [Verrucomicrobiota bacterium]|nr:50S ribosomal protein L11 methyltransferase [Limisphaera sp.]MDW8382913.1 50S ribosomal protein L11 methyltransferase [Verrucomicrobiota bacterium]
MASLKEIRDALWEIRVQCARPAAEKVAHHIAEVWSVSPAVVYHPAQSRVSVVAYLEEVPTLAQWKKHCAELKRRLKSDESVRDRQIRWRVHGRRLPQENWAESWKQHFSRLKIGRLTIRPSWLPHSLGPDEVEVVLDPGLSFGTGHHPTTLYCLEELVRLRQPKNAQSFLDAGTGSGILAVAAAKLGYAPVEALDYDPAAVETARANALANGVSDRVRVTQRNLLQMPRCGRRFAVICANVSASVLVAAREQLVGRLGAGGWLVLAGILAREFEAVQAAFEALGLACVRSRQEGRWRSGTFGLSPRNRVRGN